MKSVLEKNLGFLGFPKYNATKDGHIISFHKNKNGIMLKENNRGVYLCVNLCNDEQHKVYNIHKLIALAFIPNPNNKPCVDHINGDKTDNSVKNLRWVTHKENDNNPNTSWKKKGKYHYNYGKRVSEKTKMLISKKKKGNKAPKLYKPVSQYTIDGIFVREYKSIKEAETKTNINNSNITTCCKGRRRSAGGFKWAYKNPPLLNKNEGLIKN